VGVDKPTHYEYKQFMLDTNRTEVSATVHNAKLCTFDGSDCWIGAIKQGHRILDTFEADTKEEATAWVVDEAKRRGIQIVAVEDTTSPAAKAVR